MAKSTAAKSDSKAASPEVQMFFDDQGYNSYSDADKLDYTFLAAVKNYKDGKISEMTLGEIAQQFEANPAWHDSLYQTEIGWALDVPRLKDTDKDKMLQTLQQLEDFYSAEVG